MAKKPIWGMSSCCQPITSPMKEKKRAAANAHCLCHKAHSVSQSNGKIIREGNCIGTKSSAARMTKTEMNRMLRCTGKSYWSGLSTKPL